MFEYLQLAENLAPSVLYALAGAIQANNEGEKFDPVTFAKTILMGAVIAGAISQTDAVAVDQVVTSGVFSVLVDKVLTAIERAIKGNPKLKAATPQA